MNIFDYLDYRVFLSDFYKIQKSSNSFYSYRYMGNKLELDHGYLIRILQEKYHLGDSKISKVVKLCKFNKKEAEYFDMLVHFGKAKNAKQTKFYFEKLLSLKEIGAKQVDASQYEFYKKWYYSALRALIDCYDFRGDFKALAAKLSPSITAKQAKRAVALLESLELIKRDETGKYIVTDSHLTTGKKFTSLAVRNFQNDVITLAAESLHRHPRELREIVTLTISLDQEAVEDIRELTTQYCNAVQKRLDEVPEPRKVYQLNIQLFPLSMDTKE